MKDNIIKKNGPYHSVAEFYDKMMMHVEYPVWSTYIHDVIQMNSLLPSPILEAGCGTGIFAQQFRLNTIGLDINFPMLQQYRKRNRSVPLICDALPGLRSIRDRSFAGILVLYDTMNYLLKISEWHLFFKRSLEILYPGGWMIFDVVTPFCCETYFKNEQYEEKFSTGRFIRKTKFNVAKKIQHNYFYIYKRAAVFYEHHRQYIPAIPEIMDMIKQHPFRILAVYDDMTTDECRPDSLRVHFILQKE